MVDCDWHCESRRYSTDSRMMCSYWRRYVLDSTLTRLCHSKYISFRMINFRLVNNTASSQGNGFWSAPLFIAKRSRNSWLWKMTIVLYTTKRHFLHEYNLTLWLLRNNLFKCIFNIFFINSLVYSFFHFTYIFSALPVSTSLFTLTSFYIAPFL